MSSSDTSIYKIEHLRGSENYSVWKVRMTHILTDIGHWPTHIGDGTAVPKPPTDADELKKWKSADAKALATIVLRVADTVLVYVQNKKTAYEAWSTLSDMYESKGAIGITLARRKFHRTTCAEDADVEEHIRAMRELQGELERLGRKVEDDEFAYTLLESLPESFDSFVSAVQDDIAKDSNKLIARILAEDQRRKARTTPTDPSTALPATDKSTATCYNWGKIGHFSAECRKPRRNNDNANRQQYNSRDNRGSRNHKRHRPAGGKSRANVAASDAEDDFAFLTPGPTSAQGLGTDDWLLDSGCSRHIVRNRSDFTAYTATPGHRVVGLGDTAGIGRGEVPLTFALGSKTRACFLREAIHCPTTPFNLVSVSRLTDAGYRAIFEGTTVEIRSRNGTLLATGEKVSHLYRLHAAPAPANSTISHACTARTWDDWHRAFGHLNRAAVRRLKTKEMVTGMDVDERKDFQQCAACIQGKAHVFPFPKESERKYEAIGDMTYSDLWGKARIPGIGGHNYFISFTDATSARSRVRFLKKKEGGNVLKCIQDYVEFIRTQTGCKPRHFRFDNGKEYINQEVIDWLLSQGIEYELTAPYSSAQNGVAERLNRTIVERARTMLIAANLPFSLWPEAVNYAFYLKNISPTSALDGDITPDEAFWHRKPNVSNIQEFGAKIWVLQQDGKVHKLQAKARQHRFVGLSERSRAYRYFNVGNRTIQTSRNVIFADP